jgi:Uncharacterized protein conserved in bacteria (DUF2188)
VASHMYGVAASATQNIGSYVDKNQLFIERREQGGYAVRKPDSERASAVLPTQAEAIAWAKEHNPKGAPMIERVRNTKDGHPDKWRT